MLMAKDQPAKVLVPALRLFACCDDVPGRHGWTRSQQIDPCKRQLGEPMRCIQTTLQKNRRYLALLRPDHRKRVTDEGFDVIEWRIENIVCPAWSLALEEIEAAVKVLIASIYDIAGEHLVAGTVRGFGNVADAATRVPYRIGERFGLEQPLRAPFRLNVEAVRLLAPHVCGQGTAILVLK
ncbi:MAG TPA: hypothetical protein VM910_29970 [Bradyrhizobium sp.]|nr:hypothetical protein [Bradyrhizobium sp.]